MRDANCVVIGSPDVNPAAEIVLSRLKNAEAFAVQHGTRSKVKFRSGSLSDCYISFKNYLRGRYDPGASSFYAQFASREAKRGFIYVDGSKREKCRFESPYVPRDEFARRYGKKGVINWDLLGHVIVAPNPFAGGYPETSRRLILIMGVGGPATLGIAHLLTGHPPDPVNMSWTKVEEKNFFRESDRFLSELNRIIEEKGAAEAIVDVRIVKHRSDNDEYEDSRDIARIRPAEGKSGLPNPKPFVFVHPLPVARR